jgi:hypothetical protein
VPVCDNVRVSEVGCMLHNTMSWVGACVCSTCIAAIADPLLNAFNSFTCPVNVC